MASFPLPITLDARSRTEKRGSFSDKDRIVLLEQDNDTFERVVVSIQGSWDDRLKQMNQRITVLTSIATAVLVSIIGAMAYQVFH